MIFGKNFNRYYFKYAHWLLLGLCALIIVDWGQLKIPELYRMVVNGMNTGEIVEKGVVYAFDMDFLLDKICLPMLIIIALIAIGRFLWRVSFFGAAIKVETDLRDRMFDHCRDLSQQYYQVNKVGDMMSLFTNDLETVQDSYGNGVLMFFDALFLGILALYKMFNMSILLTVFALIPMLFLFAGSAVVGKYMSEKWERRQEAFSELSDFAQESFSGIAVIKAFSKEALELAAFRWVNKDNEKANVDFTKISTFLNVMIVLFVESVVCVIIGYGGYLVHEGVFSAGQMIEFSGYFTAIVWPIEAVSILIEMRAKGKASMKRIDELLDSEIDVKDKFGEKDFSHDFKGEIEFKNLDFTYPGGSCPVLSGVSFKINAGENIGILGKTGTGKTTIVDLIVRIYNVDDGMLFVDGIDVNEIPIKALRSAIAYVPQDNFLFSDTIANNIAFSFDEEVPEEKIVEAAVGASVDDNIREFPDKYDTVLGERGVTVSGGQKQRISIARALMKNAKILILDDSVSAVDTKTERYILDNLKNNRKGMTTLLIAHRISTIEQMDKILFIDEGKVVDFGTHQELLERCPMYVEMVELQKLEEERGQQ